MALMISSLNVVAKVASPVKPSKAGTKYANVGAAVKAGALTGIAPFEEGLDVFGFCNEIDAKDLQRFKEAELTHGRVSMLAALGFVVGEQVEGSSFLFDSQVTGPAINHFQQVPGLFWGLIAAVIFAAESTRVQKAWANPFESDKLFLLKDDYTPGELEFDPLGLSNGKDAAYLADMKLKEVNNGRLAMISISGMIAQELVNGLNLIPADEVLEMGKADALLQMEAKCAGAVDEAACAKAFEAGERAAVFASTLAQ